MTAAAQLAVVELTTTVRLQLVVLKVPVPLLPNKTVPVGVVGEVGETSFTVTVQLVAWFNGTVVGVHVSTVCVAWSALTGKLNVPKLVACTASPP